MSSADFKDRPELQLDYSIWDAIGKQYIKRVATTIYKSNDEVLENGKSHLQTSSHTMKCQRGFIECIGRFGCFLYNYIVSQNKDVSFINEIMHAYILDENRKEYNASIPMYMDKSRKSDAYKALQNTLRKKEIQWNKMDIVLYILDEIMDLLRTQCGDKPVSSINLRMTLIAINIQDLFIIWFMWKNIV